MKNKKTRVKLVAVIVLAVVSVVLWSVFKPDNSGSSSEIVTSGFIEANPVTLAAELGGRISTINVAEGDRVVVGQKLVELDKSLLGAQEKQAAASVELAQVNLELARVSEDGARMAYENALDVQNSPLELEAKIEAARGELEMAETNLKYVNEIETDWKIASAESRQETAAKILDNLEQLDATGLVGLYQMRRETYPAEGELAQAELNLNYQRDMSQYFSIPAAKIRRDYAQKALDNLLAIKGNPQEINAAADRANASYQMAEVSVKAAEKQLEQVAAALEVVHVQLGKLSIVSPVSGIVIDKYMEVGEIAPPGASVLTVADLSRLTLTAYVPESKIGLVKLGEQVAVTVDSYPGETFPGKVNYISPQAVFTPRNVQLKEERERTVFAVKIHLDNPEQKLKPGMPADARILIDSAGR